MFELLICFSKKRGSWLLLSLTAFFIVLFGFYFQYILMSNPCILCIYQRCAIYGIFIAGLIGACAPSTLLRFVSIAIWLYSACKGLRISINHIDMQLNPSLFKTCDFFVSFPLWLPLDKWFPFIFNAKGDCFIQQHTLLSKTISQWMVIIFGIYLVLAIIMLLLSLFCTCKKVILSIGDRKVK